MEYKVYTDGVADNFIAPHYGGWAWRSIDEDGVIIDGCGFVSHTTSNRMAMFAIIEALKKLPDGITCEIFTNNQYLTYPFNNKDNWRKYESNSDMIEKFHTLVYDKRIDCKVTWVKSGTETLLDEMRDLAIGQFNIISDIEITDPKLYSMDKEYHKKINALINSRVSMEGIL